MEYNMGKTYITFGQDHHHKIGHTVFDHNCVAEIQSESREDGRNKAFDLFGPKWCFEYYNNEIDKVDVKKWFPRGIIRVPQD